MSSLPSATRNSASDIHLLRGIMEVPKEVTMGNAYELDGQLFTNVGEFLDALSHEYKHGDTDLAVQTLEDYGFSVSDIHTGNDQPHPSAVRDDAHAITVQDDEDDEEDEDLKEDKEEE